MNSAKNTFTIFYSSLLIALVLLCPIVLTGQTEKFYIQYSTIGAEEGLIDKNHRDIFQDRLGYVWLLTINKLYRFDGVNCIDFSDKIYKASGKNQMEGVRLVGKPGDKLLVIIAKAILEIDLKTNSVRRVFHFNESAEFVRITDITIYKNDYWVLLSNGGIRKFDPQFKLIDSFSIENNSVLKYSDTQIMDDHLFYSCNNALNVYDLKGNLQFHLYNKKITIDNLDYLIKGLSSDEHALILKRGDQTFISPFRIKNHKIIYGQVSTYTSKSQSNIARLSSGQRVFLPGDDILVEQKNGTVISLKNQMTSLFGSNFNYTFLKQTSDFTIWIYTNNSYLLLKIDNYPFHTYFSNPYDRDQVRKNSIRAIVCDDKGKLWASGYDGFHIKQIDTSNRTVSACSQSYLGSSMYRMKVIGNEIFGLSELGYMLAFRQGTNCASRFILDLPLNGMIFYDFQVMDQDTIWLATSNGLSKFKFDNQMVSRTIIPFSKIPKTRVNYIYKLSRDSIYVATAEGIYLLNNQGNIRAVYSNSKKSDIFIPDCLIYHVFKSSSVLWVSSDIGLIKIDLATKKYELYNVASGLPDNNVYAAIEDPKGFLWLSTNQGITRFNPVNETISNYSTKQGLPNDEYNNAAFYKSATNTIYFGGLNGITIINPYLFGTQEPKDIPVYIERFKYVKGNRTIDSLLYAQKIITPFKLNPNFKQLSFTLFTPYFYNSQNHRFRYRIKNQDTASWISIKGNLLVFNYLPPGTYHIEIQSSLASEGWSKNSLEFTIIITKFWYQSLLFYILSALSLIGALILIYRMRINKYKNLDMIRTNISTDIHDEIGSTMSSISLYTQALLMNTTNSKEKEILTKIKDNAQSVQDSLGDIIWSVRPSMDTYSALFTKMRRFALELTEPKDIRCHFDFAETLSLRKINMERRRQIYLFYKEVVNNAIKHSGAENLYLSFRQEGNLKRLIIRDDGKGFDENEVSRGNGLINMRQRAKDLNGDLRISTRLGGGTVIALSLR